jgi:hypothetical protein
VAMFTRKVFDLDAKPPLRADSTVGSAAWRFADGRLLGAGREGFASCALDVPDHYMVECKLRMDPKASAGLVMRQNAEPGTGYRLVLRPEKQEAELSSPAFRNTRRIELDAAKPITIRAFVQGSMIETFINDQYALSCRGYDYATGRLGLEVSGGDAEILELAVKEIPSE